MATLFKILVTLFCAFIALGFGLGSIDLFQICLNRGIGAGPFWVLLGFVLSMAVLMLAIIVLMWSKKARAIFD